MLGSARSASVAFALVACGSAGPTANVVPNEPAGEPVAVAPGIDLALDVRGRRIDVSSEGVLHAEGCGAARFDWEGLALTGAGGAELVVASVDLEVGATDVDSRADVRPLRRISAPDGTPLLTVTDSEVRAGERPIFRVEPDGTLADVGGGATAISSSAAVPERHRMQVLALLALVATCWEAHPVAVSEP